MESSKRDAFSLDSDNLDTPTTNLLDCGSADIPHVRVDRAHVVPWPIGHGILVPRLIADLGDDAAKRFLEFFAANIRNPRTRGPTPGQQMKFLALCASVGLPSANHPSATHTPAR